MRTNKLPVFQFAFALSAQFSLCAVVLLSGCSSNSVAAPRLPPTAPRPPGAQSVTLLPATGGVASGTIAAAPVGIAAAISGAGDQSGVTTFTTTTINVASSSAQPQAAFAVRTQMLYRSHAEAHPRTESHPADDSAIKYLLQHRAVGQSQRSHLLTSTIPPQLTVGSTVANVWITKFAIGGGAATYALFPMTLEAQTAHGNIWVDNSLISGPNASNSFSNGSAAVSAATVGQDFEVGYVSDTTHFASPDYPLNAPGIVPQNQTCDVNGQPTGQAPAFIAEPADHRINVMLLNAASDALGDGVGGYFASANYATQASLNCELQMGLTFKSNEAPMIYVAWTEAAGAATELQYDMTTATAHELQHLINFVNHTFLPAAAGTPNFDSSETSTNNEGLSVLAQDFALHTQYPNVTFDTYDALSLAQAYLAAPQNFSVSGFRGIDAGAAQASAGCRGCYGGAYLLQRYLYDRFGGDTYSHRIETSGLDGFASLAAGCSCGETAQQLLGDFFVAMPAQSLRVAPQNLAYHFGSLNLNGTYPSPIADQPSRTLLGLNQIVVPSGGAASASPPLGGAAFFSVSGQGTRTVTLTDTNAAAGFNLSGALIQGS